MESLLFNEVINFEGELLDRVWEKIQELESNLKLKFTRGELVDAGVVGVNKPDIQTPTDPSLLDLAAANNTAVRLVNRNVTISALNTLNGICWSCGR